MTDKEITVRPGRRWYEKLVGFGYTTRGMAKLSGLEVEDVESDLESYGLMNRYLHIHSGDNDHNRESLD